jgi:3D (Asp-Asp-Asp) domain-containing protein
MKSLFGGSAIAAAALLSALLLFAARPSVAETAVSQSQQTIQQPSKTQTLDPVVISSPGDTLGKALPETPIGKIVEPPKAAQIPVALPVSYVATAYSLRGRTASGKFVSQGIIAADPKFLPLGSRVHVQAGSWSGEYLVADTGGAIKGRKIDIWTPSTREAMRFGRRTVKLTVLSYGGKRAAAKRRVQT